MIRLFVGLDLPEALRGRCALLSGGVPGARWISPENLHLTLRFIGEVDHALADDIAAALDAIDAPAFDLTLSGFGHFERGRELGAVYAAVLPNPALCHLQAKIESALVRVGLPPEGRKFTPHVSLARLRDTAPERLAALLGSHGLFRAGPAPIRSFQLFSSTLGRSGSVYRIEADYPLSEPFLDPALAPPSPLEDEA